VIAFPAAPQMQEVTGDDQQGEKVIQVMQPLSSFMEEGREKEAPETYPKESSDAGVF